jgi:UDP-N-acetylglucosamine/UDP-N-acetylgalactosamine diphosphorylase
VTDKSQLLGQLEPYDQTQLLAFWDDLDDAGRERLTAQINSLDLPLIRSLFEGEDSTIDWAALSERAVAPPAIRLDDDQSRFASDTARRRGEEVLAAGQVGMILVAGGQGTRLGSEDPKGMFSLGPVSGRTLFAILVDRLRAMSIRYQQPIPLYLMTSPATDEPTRAYFAKHKNFGLPDEQVHFFCQGVMPAVDARSGQILLSAPDAVAVGPDGHGGMLAALQGSDCLDEASRREIKLFFYGQVDNPLLQVCDPFFLGCHLLAESEMTTQVVQKAFPRERVGNVVQVDGQTQIIEYSDLPDEVAERRDADRSLRLWAGSLAVHVFDRAFLQRVAGRADSLPFHRARKKVPYRDAEGQLVTPEAPNALKFERFIFDLLPAASQALVVEAAKEQAFAPVKNGEGETDTPATARCAMVEKDKRLLERAGLRVAAGIDVEVNPLWALDADEAVQKIQTGTEITKSTYFV